MHLTGLVQRHRRLAYAIIGIAVAPLALKATYPCFNRPEVGINSKIIGETNIPIKPPVSKTVCGTDLYYQQNADLAVFTQVTEKMQQEGYKRGRLGQAPLSHEEITAQTMALFKAEWEAAVKRVTAPKKSKNFRFWKFTKIK